MHGQREEPRGGRRRRCGAELAVVGDAHGDAAGDGDDLGGQQVAGHDDQEGAARAAQAAKDGGGS